MKLENAKLRKGKNQNVCGLYNGEIAQKWKKNIYKKSQGASGPRLDQVCRLPAYRRRTWRKKRKKKKITVHMQPECASVCRQGLNLVAQILHNLFILYNYVYCLWSLNSYFVWY